MQQYWLIRAEITQAVQYQQQEHLQHQIKFSLPLGCSYFCYSSIQTQCPKFNKLVQFGTVQHNYVVWSQISCAFPSFQGHNSRNSKHAIFNPQNVLDYQFWDYSPPLTMWSILFCNKIFPTKDSISLWNSINILFVYCKFPLSIQAKLITARKFLQYHAPLLGDSHLSA